MSSFLLGGSGNSADSREVVWRAQHRFVSRTTGLVECCDFCGNGLPRRGSSLQCTVCRYNCHAECSNVLTVDCLMHRDGLAYPASLRSQALSTPHVFQPLTLSISDSRYCNECRNRIVPVVSSAQMCSICGYMVHDSCTASANQNCIVPYNPVQDLTFYHHWVEGNLSKKTCYVCDKQIPFGSGMTGYRCFWCFGCVHGSCLKKAGTCTLGSLKDMKIPAPCFYKVQENSKEIPAPEIPELLDATLFSIDVEVLRMAPWLERPVAVVINTRSGSGQGTFLANVFRKILNPLQICDLAKRDLKSFLSSFTLLSAQGREFTIVVAGGDGTLGWVCDTVDELNFGHQKPSMAVIPIGTGNEMARYTGWGSAYSTGEDPVGLLTSLRTAEPEMVDRWRCIATPAWSSAEVDDVVNSDLNPQQGKQSESHTEPIKLFWMVNFSAGVDAEVSLQFHNTRNSRPWLCSLRAANKLQHVGLGARAAIPFVGTGMKDIGQFLQLYVDDLAVQIPSGVETLVLLNISSYATGLDMWREGEARFAANSPSDGQLEVLATYGTVHMARMQLGVPFSAPSRLAQGRTVRIVVKSSMPIQADGEPWMQEAGFLEISRAGQVRMLKRGKK